MSEMVLVITGDVIGSTNNGLLLTRDTLVDAFNLIEKNFPETRTGGAFQIIRGDGFQGAFGSVARGLRCAFFSHAFFKAQARLKKATPVTGVRMGIGVGPGRIEPNGVLASTGEAFVLSGRALDFIKDSKESTLRIRSPWGVLNEILDMEVRLLEPILAGWTKSQAHILVEALLDIENTKSQMDIATSMGKNQSFISRQLKKANYETIKMFCDHVDNLTKKKEITQRSEGC